MIQPSRLWHTPKIILFVLGSLATVSAGCAEGARDGDISRLLTLGQVEAARALLEASDPTQVDKLFFDARLLKSQGRLELAIGLFRRILQRDPNHINARRELAHTLMLNRDFGPAEFHFKQLLRIDNNQKMRAGYRRFLASIRRDKPVGVSGYFSILPSTNVNRGTENSVVETAFGDFSIDEGSKSSSGIGLTMGVSGYARRAVSANERVILNWGGSATRYETESNNNQTANLALRYERATRTGLWFISPYYQKIWRPETSTNTVRGARFGLTSRITAIDKFDLTLSRERRIHPSTAYLDGPFASLSLNLSRQLSPSRSIRAGIMLDRSSPQSEHLRYTGTQMSFGAGHIWQGGLQTSFGFQLGHRDFAANFPLHNEPRDDQFVRLNSAVHHTRIQILGYAPRLSCSHTMNWSSVAFYEHKVTECQMTLSRNF